MNNLSCRRDSSRLRAEALDFLVGAVPKSVKSRKCTRLIEVSEDQASILLNVDAVSSRRLSVEKEKSPARGSLPPWRHKSLLGNVPRREIGD